MTRSLTMVLGMGLSLLLSQASCVTGERAAVAAEGERATCELGELRTVQQCGSALDACHVCGRPNGDDGVCLQPCTVGKDECPGSQRCVAVEALAGGYARVGDCPTGYCE